MKARTTYTPFDTFKMISDNNLKPIPEKVTSTSDNMEAILAYNDGVLTVLGNLANDIAMTEKQIASKMAWYMEGQVHGGITVEDIDTLVVDYPQDPKARTDLHKPDADLAEAFIKKYPSIKLRHR